MSSRREFVKSIPGLIAGAWAATSVRSWAADEKSALVVPGSEGMIVRSYRFLDLESPVEYFNSWITPVPHFFVRNHMHEPATIDPDGWTLTVGGEVEKPYTLSLA